MSTTKDDAIKTGNLVLSPKNAVSAVKHTLSLDSHFSNHPEYSAVKDSYTTIRDVLKGSLAVKKAGERYLQKLTAQDSTSYLRYKNRAVFFNLSAKILNINTSMVTRRTPTLDYVDALKDYFVTDGPFTFTFHELFKKTIRELLSMNRVAIHINIVDGKPQPELIKAESYFNWVEDENGILETVFISDYEYTVSDDNYTRELVRYDYKLHLVDGIYTVTKYDSSGIILEESQPSINGKTLKFVPFIPICQDGIGFSTDLGVFFDIVALNLSHYNTSADLENGRHYVGCPTPYITGATSQDSIKLGGEQFLVIPPDKAKVGFLEFEGQGLNALKDALSEKQSQMSQFSAQLMDSSSKGSEAEGTVRLRYSGESASLSDYALSAETGLRQAYNIIAFWLSEKNPNIDINKDFLSTKLTSQELNALSKSFIDGAISEEVFMYNLERGEMTPKKDK